MFSQEYTKRADVVVIFTQLTIPDSRQGLAQINFNLLEFITSAEIQHYA